MENILWFGCWANLKMQAQKPTIIFWKKSLLLANNAFAAHKCYGILLLAALGGALALERRDKNWNWKVRSHTFQRNRISYFKMYIFPSCFTNNIGSGLQLLSNHIHSIATCWFIFYSPFTAFDWWSSLIFFYEGFCSNSSKAEVFTPHQTVRVTEQKKTKPKNPERDVKIPFYTFCVNGFLNRHHLFLPSQHDRKVQHVWLLKAVFNAPWFSPCLKDKREKWPALLLCHYSYWIALLCRSPSCPFHRYGLALNVKVENGVIICSIKVKPNSIS